MKLVSGVKDPLGNLEEQYSILEYQFNNLSNSFQEELVEPEGFWPERPQPGLLRPVESVVTEPEAEGFWPERPQPGLLRPSLRALPSNLLPNSMANVYMSSQPVEIKEELPYQPEPFVPIKYEEPKVESM